jgi:hypothetical protein
VSLPDSFWNFWLETERVAFPAKDGEIIEAGKNANV